MSTKSKRRAARRHPEHAQLSSLNDDNETLSATRKQKVASAIVGELLNVITFGALEPEPQSARS